MPEPSSDLWILLRVLASLAVVLALALVVLRWVLPRLGPMALGGRKSPRLGVLEVRPLDREHRLALVEVVRAGRRQEVLVAFGGGGATFFDAWPADTGDDPEEVES